MAAPLLRALAGAACLVSPAAAQHTLHLITGAGAGDSLGYALAAAGDPDDDGLGDLLVGVPRADAGGVNAGAVLVLDGASGALLHRVEGGAAGDHFGWSVAGAGDVDGDGRDDWIAGAPYASSSGGGIQKGEARVHSGLDGRLLHLFQGTEQFGRLGSAVAGAGDVDGDGRADLLVGAPLEDGAGVDSGRIYVFSGRTGAMLHVRSGDQAGDQLGSSVAGLGDLDLDGRPDFAAGAPLAGPGGSHAGMARVYSGANGSTLRTLVGPSPGAELGRAIAGLADLTGDLRPELAVGAWRDPAAGEGAGSVRVHSGSDFGVLATLHGQPGAGFGAALCGAGDVDGDGLSDLVVGSPEEGGGAARVYAGGSWNELHHLAADAPGDRFGSALACGFDANGDGYDEYAVGAWLADGPPADAGRALVVSHVDPLGSAYCFGDGTGTPCPCLNESVPGEGCRNSTGSGGLLAAAGSTSVAQDDLVLEAEQLVPGQPALLFAGANAVNGGMGLPFGDGLRCAGGALVRLGVRVPDAAGAASFGPGLVAAGGFRAGELKRFQVWYRDPTGGPCGTSFNLTHGYAVELTP